MTRVRHFDWREVVALEPRGLLLIRDGGWLVYGRVTTVVVDGDDFVRISLASATELRIGSTERRVSTDELLSRRFPNMATEFAIERHPRYGARIRFGENFLYLAEAYENDPRKLLEDACSRAPAA